MKLEEGECSRAELRREERKRLQTVKYASGCSDAASCISSPTAVMITVLLLIRRMESLSSMAASCRTRVMKDEDDGGEVLVKASGGNTYDGANGLSIHAGSDGYEDAHTEGRQGTRSFEPEKGGGRRRKEEGGEGEADSVSLRRVGRGARAGMELRTGSAAVCTQLPYKVVCCLSPLLADYCDGSRFT
eukprot:764360-Hanusia_phi.AAC.6